MAAVTLERVSRRDDTVMVPMNDVGAERWSKELQFKATQELNGCTAIAIFSDTAGIFAHVASRIPLVEGDENM